MERRSIKVSLASPIRAHDEDVTELVIQEPRALEFEAMDRGKGELQKVNHLLAACAKVPYSSILTLCSRDYQAAMEALGKLGFQEASPLPSESSE